MKARHGRLDDERLAALVGRGDEAAFEVLYDRHHAALLAFCRHMVGSREDGEDALQQAFLRAHKALADGRTPDRVRPWLFAIARNRCLTLIAARRDAALPADDIEQSFDGLAVDVERRADLRELVTELGRLPDDQRGALVLAELGDFSHPEIAGVIGCSPAKVKALVFQARTTLIADRDARRTPCDEIRTLLETARGGMLRRGSLRRHLRQCDPCAAYRIAMEGRRTGLALVLPVAPTAGLKAAVLAGAGGLGGGGVEAASAAAALLGPGSLGAASGGGVAGGAAAGGGIAGGAAAAGGGIAGGAAVAGGVAVKAIVAKAAVAAAIAAGATGGGVAVNDLARDEPVRTAVVAPAAERAPADRPVRTAAPADDPIGAADAAPPALGDDPAVEDGATSPARPASRRLRRVARRLRDGDPAVVRRVRRRLQRADPAVARRVRRRLLLARLRAGAEPKVGAVVGPAGRPDRRRRRRPQAPPTAAPVPEATPEPVATPAPTATPEPRIRRRRRPVPTPDPVPVPVPTAEPTPAATTTPEPEATSEPAPAATPAP